MKPLQIKDVIFGSGKPKICIPIVESSREAIIQEAKEIEQTNCDLVEWRADFYYDIENETELKQTLKELKKVLKTKLLLFTFRSIKEGGSKQITEDRYFHIIELVASSKCVDLIDIETFCHKNITSLIKKVQEYNVAIIGSNHDFEKTPAKNQIIERLCKMQEMQVDICKIALMPQNKADVLTLLDATLQMHTNYADRPIITMSMSKDGLISRITGELFGSCVTFASLHKASAPGQISIDQLEPVLNLFHQDDYEIKFTNYLSEDARRIRQEVFVEEQNFQNEFETREDTCIHLVLYKDHQAIATGRMYEENGVYVLGRIAVDKTMRKKHLGSRIVKELEKEAKRLGAKKVKLSAQVRAKGFYQTLGYQEEGAEYFDEYCPHITMTKKIG